MRELTKGGDLMSGRIRKTLAVGMLGIMGVLMLAMGASLACGQVKKEGWANVPGGQQVWLEPGRHAYEHDTGLVRDLVTGMKSRPVTPQSLAQQQSNCCPNTVAPLAVNPLYPLNPYPAPFPSPYPTPYPISVQPVPPTYVPRPWFDLGPNSVYLPSLYNSRGGGYGAKLGSPGTINGKWQVTKLPK